MAAKVVYIWLGLSSALAWHTAQMGNAVKWTLARHVIGQGTVVVAIKKVSPQCIASSVADVRTVNVVSEERSRISVGRAGHIASVLFKGYRAWQCEVRLLACIATEATSQQGVAEPAKSPFRCSGCGRLTQVTTSPGALEAFPSPLAGQKPTSQTAAAV